MLFIIFSQVEEVGKAHPRILEAVETMIQKGKWTVPGKLSNWICFTILLLKIILSRLQGQIRRSLSSLEGVITCIDLVECIMFI
jgi:hypothetical protein